ncbi:MAG: nitroreductase family protein [Hyphomonadaceae bacterium]
MTTRRHVLSWLAAAPALGACGGGGPDPAAAWRTPGAGETDPRRFSLAHAILAPNPHNTQPWQVTFDGEDGVTLYCDLERRLPFTDPLDRQITIGCGAFVELYRIAARSLGHACIVTPFPQGAPGPRLDERPVAHIRFNPVANAAADPLFDFITFRRTNRNVYDLERAPDDVALARAASAVGGFLGAAQWTTQPDRVAALRDLVWRAFDREMHTAGALEETYQWLRIGRNAIAEHRDGLAIHGAMIPLFKAIGALDRDDFLDPDSTANTTALRDWREKAETSMGFMWLSTPDDTPAARLSAGHAYARLNLAATALGVAMHPWSQALQEYEEMADLYAEAREMLEADDNTLQMLVRVGYAEPVEPSARRGVEAILRPA